MIDKVNNTRYSLTISKDLKAKLEEEAAKDKRSLNNYIIKALEDKIKKD